MLLLEALSCESVLAFCGDVIVAADYAGVGECYYECGSSTETGAPHGHGGSLLLGWSVAVAEALMVGVWLLCVEWCLLYVLVW